MASGPVHKPSAATLLCAPQFLLPCPLSQIFSVLGPRILRSHTRAGGFHPFLLWMLRCSIWFQQSEQTNGPDEMGAGPTLLSRVAWTRLRQTILRVAAIDPETSWNRMLRQEWQDIRLGRAAAQRGQQVPPAAPGDWYTTAAMVFSPELNKHIFHPMHPLWKGGWGRMSVII